ncbi:MAG: hypothetical protein K6G81_05140 [Lachnospiraceae bacterium]|nr:hypothetical protein [Lachnospiraceae bacterium]
MRFRYKVLIVVLVFIGAFVYFASDISGNFFGNSSQAMDMSAATLPTIYLQTGDDICNRLHGYASNLDHMLMRETITPIRSDRVFTVLIEQNESDVKKLKYEVYNTDGREIESDSFTVLETEEGPKKVRIALQETLKSGQEYIVKITLITNLSKRVYYYTRIKMYDNGHIPEKLEFAKNFHEILLHGTQTEKEGLKKYLESSRKTDNTSFANVSIKSSFSLITWGELEPEVIWEEIPAIHEFYDQLATIELMSLVKADAGTGEELYLVKENFRFLYTEARVYLYNYDRTMETLFDVNRTSLHRDEFKLGVTMAGKVQTGASDSLKYLAFSYNGGIYVFDVAKNLLNCAFSFRGGAKDYSRELYDQHNIRLIKVHDNGDTDFLVYGYMNRGEYEGRVGIVLYRYINRDQRIEEQLYIPVNTSYQLLEADFNDFTYLSEKDVLYFSLYNAIYAYDMATRTLQTIAKDVQDSHLVFCPEDRYLAWQEGSDDTAIRSISVLSFDNGEIRKISSPGQEIIRLLGRIDNNIIYAYSKESDFWILANGSIKAPAYRLCIENAEGQIVKTYEDKGFYIDSIVVEDNKVTLKRMTRKAGDTIAYNDAEDDTIMNRLVENTPPVHISKRVTDRILTEYYITLPQDVVIEKIPYMRKAPGTVISFDTTVRISEPEHFDQLFYAYCYGNLTVMSDKASESIAAADTSVGTVINRDGRVVWERGIKAARASIGALTPVLASGRNLTSLQAAMETVLKYKNADADMSAYDIRRETVRNRLQRELRNTVVDLSGANLDEVLYYVYKQRPVIAFKADGNAVVITAYDAVSVTYYEPLTDKTTKQGIKEAAAMFEAAGNLFVSYIE